MKKKGGNWKSIVRLRGLQPGIQEPYTKEKAEPTRHQDAGKQDGGKHDKISFDGNSSGAFFFYYFIQIFYGYEAETAAWGNRE